MTDIAQNIIAKANLARVSSLPELLLCEQELLHKVELCAAEGNSAILAMGEMLTVDLFLYTQILASNEVKNNDAYASPIQLLRRMGDDTLKAKLRQATTQISFGRVSTQRFRFLKQLYLQSVLSRNLAEQIARQVLPESADKAQMVQQAGFCGLFLNIGALVLEQVFAGQYLEMLGQAATTAELLEEESSAFGIDHAALGAQLLKSWGIERFCCDALQYHHLEISQILDATPLVKVAWLANQLSDEKTYLEAPVWADSLFDVQEASLMQIKEAATASVNASLKTLNIAFSTMRYLPLPATEDTRVLKQEIKAFKQLRKKAEADNLFISAKESLAAADGPVELGQAIDSVTRLLFGPCESLLFIQSEDGTGLSCLTGTPGEGDINQLVIRCEAERSIVAECFVNNASILNLPDEELTVIDRQLLSLLGTDNLCCEPVVKPNSRETCGVLVLGINVNQLDSYKKQVYLRYDLSEALGKILVHKQEASGAENDLVVNYERRIRETIHEANNPLGIIKNYLQLLSMKQNADSKIQSEINFMKSEIDRVSNILEKLKEEPTFPEAVEKNTTVNINSVVTKLVGVFEGAFADSENINIEVSLDQELPEIFCRENAIRQIITNLVKNAAEAIEGGGTILVKTAGNFYMNGECYIQLIVKDNGPGMTENIVNALFVSSMGMGDSININSGNDATINSTNNSTKGNGHVGSGLTIVQDLVAELGGQFSCQTNRAVENSGNFSGTEIIVIIPTTSLTAVTKNSPLTTDNNSEGTH